ncbi:ETC complex I subunit, partial [Paracoccaceae bacterium]|nr:ETC complex I subunit [Paracoccaceae bacterium]
QSQVTLRFENKEAAIQYAKQKALAYEVIEPKTRKANIRAGGYGENFATTRRGAWTH